MKLFSGLIFRAAFWVGAFVLSGCASAAIRLQPPLSTAELRLADIESLVDREPAKAVHLIGSFEVRYRDEASEADLRKIDVLRSRAEEALSHRFNEALKAEEWEAALSVYRSLDAIGKRPADINPTDLQLSQARGLLKNGESLRALLLASKIADAGSLSASDAALFLDAALAGGVRRTVDFFMRVAEKAGAAIPERARAFANSADSAADMVKGVATVLVDRGLRIEQGRGVPDRVIGSAFFVDPRGYLVTNYHVVSSEVDPKYEGYSRLFIRLGDSSQPRIPAKVVGWDPLLDLALIKAEIQPAYVFSVFDQAQALPGDRVLAIGTPAGLESTVTAGIVSAIGRRFLQLGSVLQIDAAVNHGNSGGPVIAENGRLVGVVFAGIEQFEGLNFAIPASRLIDILPALFKGGRVEHAWIGLSLSERREGIESFYVFPGSPAAELSFPEGIGIKTLGSRPASSILAAQEALFSRNPGELVVIETDDGVARIVLTAARPLSPLADAIGKDSRERLIAPLFGILLSPSGAGPFAPEYLIKRVLRGSIADEAGLSENDPVSVRGFQVDRDVGVAVLDIFVKKRRMGYLESVLQLPALLDTPDTL